MQQICYRSKCLFIRSDGAMTESLPTAIGWVSEKSSVVFFYRGVKIGDLKYIGVINSLDEVGHIVLNDGIAAYNASDSSYYIGIPDYLLNHPIVSEVTGV